jgi:hypothetical protein
MATLDDVARIALDLPETVETVETGQRTGRTWSVRGKTFAWERAFSKADIKRFGGEPVPAPPILAVRVDDLAEKEVVLAAGHKGVFTIAHFDGYARGAHPAPYRRPARAPRGDRRRMGRVRSARARAGAP